LPTASNPIATSPIRRTPLSFWLAPANSRNNLWILRSLAWITITLTGFLQAWSNRFSLSPDATNYLDIASAYLRHDWHNAINAYWSPLFSWLLAIVLALFRPGLYNESTALHLLNFAGLLLSLLCFEYFFSAFLQFGQNSTLQTLQTDETLPELVLWGLAYSLFFSTSLFVLSAPSITTPDVWAFGLTFLAAGLTLRIAVSAGGTRHFVCLGITLGFAYLAKAFYFPLSFVFLIAAWFAANASRKTFRQFVLALVFFTLVTGPWVTLLSRNKGRLTFGDAGRIAFAMTVDGIQQAAFWQGENSTGTPRHPVRQLLPSPRLFEFAGPIAGTDPPGYDFSYWMDGVRPHFDLRGQLNVFRQSFGTFLQIFLAQVEFAAALLTLVFLAPPKRNWLRPLRNLAPVWIPALLACAGYALILVEGRYVASFLLLLWVAAFYVALQAGSGISRRLALAAILAVMCITCLRMVRFVQTSLGVILAHPQNVDWQIAQALHSVGIQPGDRIAAIADTGELEWARLAGVKFVSQIPFGQEGVFWSQDVQTQRVIFDVFASTGAKIVITMHPPICAASQGWVPLAQTGLFVHSLQPQAPPIP
jgi:hypothetical protein